MSKYRILKALVSSLVLGVCLSTGALPASAEPIGDEVNATYSWSAKYLGYLEVGGGVDLGPGEEIHTSEGAMLNILTRDRKPRGMSLTWHAPARARALVAYPMSLNGQPTEYWLGARIDGDERGRGFCEIFEGKPSAPGAEKPVWSSPFQCVTSDIGTHANFSVTVAKDRWTAGGIVESLGAELGPGKPLKSTTARNVEVIEDADHNPGIRAVWTETVRNVSAKVVFPILRDGKTTSYWLQTHIHTGYTPSWADADCEIFEGEPGTQGVEKPTWSSPFECRTTRDGAGNDWNFSLYGPSDLARASGAISTQDDLSLTDGTFKTDVSEHQAGEPDLAPGQSTEFSAVLRTGDKPFYENQARTEFSYEIIDGGKKTGLWVAGVSTNFRGAVKFSGDGRCAIYGSNPLEGEGRLDDRNPIESSDYSCTAKGDFVKELFETRRHYHAAFVVSRAHRKVMAEASGAIAAKDLSLTGGMFSSDVPYHQDGDADVAAGQATSFSTVLRDGDTTRDEWQARMEFSYQIVDGGKKTGLWVAGLSTNFRGILNFSADGRCAIYGSNPLEGEGRLDDRNPIESSDYSCTAEGDFVHGDGEDDNVHYNTSFSVVRNK